MFLRSFTRISVTSGCLSKFYSTVTTGEIVQPLAQLSFHTDRRRSGERKTYGEPLVLKDGRTVRFEIADLKDEELVAEQFLDGFIKQVSILRAINATHDDLRLISYELTRTVLKSGGTLLGFHDDKLACFRLVRYVKHEDIPKLYGPLAKPGDPPAVPVFPEDYGTLIDSMPWEGFASKVLAVLLCVPEDQLGKFLPLDIKNLAFGEVINVHDDFHKNNLGTHLSALTEKMAVEHGCNYIANITVATASTKIAAKKGYKVLYNMPYDKFYVHGKLIFQNLWDGATASNLNLGKLV